MEGMDNLNAVLRELPEAMRSRILAEGVKMAAKPMVAAAKNFAPVRSGALRKSITSVVRQRKSKGTAVAVVGPSTEYFRNGKKLKKGESHDDADRPSKYAHLVEFGHANAKGKGRTPAYPFMRPAVIATKQLVVSALIAGISTGMVREARRLVKLSNKK